MMSYFQKSIQADMSSGRITEMAVRFDNAILSAVELFKCSRGTWNNCKSIFEKRMC